MSASVKVAYLGPPGTFSHQAALQEFPNGDLRPQKSIGACFTALSTDQTDYAVVPLENSTNGQVVPTWDLLSQYFLNNPSFMIFSDQFVPISHCLISFASSPEDITDLYSHPQVWSQCTEFLKTTTASRNDTQSTAAAVANLSSLPETSAAIASPIAAQFYNVPILSQHLEDSSENTTRFLVLGKNPLSATNLSLILFTTHNESGALASVLGKFAKYTLNLRNIATRPSKTPWQPIFFVEVWDNSSLAQCLQELRDENLVIELVRAGGFKDRS